MSDGKLTVRARDLIMRSSMITLDVTEQGLVSVVMPTPGTAYVDPETELPELQGHLELLRQVALGVRAQRAQESAAEREDGGTS